MIQSMTGYGRASAGQGNNKISKSYIHDSTTGHRKSYQI